MINVTRTFLPPRDAYATLLDVIWQTGHITNSGPLTRDLAERLRKHLDVPRLELASNGTIALQLAIKALNLKGEIITSPYSYVATTNAILWEGCEPVFVDIEPESFGVNSDLIEAAITERTSAILVTHVYGYPCDVNRIQDIADRYRLKVIYDAAHAFGVKLNGQSLLSHGDCSTLSFHATKLFHTAEGGAVVCNDDDLAHRVFLMSKFGHIGEDDYVDLGVNAKMSELHAAMGLAVLPHIEQIIAARKQCSAWYDEFLQGIDLQRPRKKPGLEYNFAYYPVVFSSHDLMMQARQKLQEHGIVPRRYFHPSLNRLPFLREELKRHCPISESVSTRVLCLPLYVGLQQESIKEICGLIASAHTEGVLRT